MKFCLKIYVTLKKGTVKGVLHSHEIFFSIAKPPFHTPDHLGINNRGSLWPHACLSALNSLRIYSRMDLNEVGGILYTQWKTKKRKDTGGRRLKEREEERECVKSQKFN